MPLISADKCLKLVKHEPNNREDVHEWINFKKSIIIKTSTNLQQKRYPDTIGQWSLLKGMST